MRGGIVCQRAGLQDVTGVIGSPGSIPRLIMSDANSALSQDCGAAPLFVGTSESRAVLDSVRVAGQLPGADGGKKFVVWGHSQGGHVALFTGLIAKPTRRNRICSVSAGLAHGGPYSGDALAVAGRERRSGRSGIAAD
jgi:hypothetical protein